MLKTYFNRVVTALMFLSGLLGAVVPALQSMDLTSTIGIESGVLAIITSGVTFLVGWQKHEARVESSLTAKGVVLQLGQANDWNTPLAVKTLPQPEGAPAHIGVQV